MITKEMLKRILTEKWPYLIIVATTFFVLATNYESGTIIMGLDNASNYFYPLQIFKQIEGSATFIYSGLIFTAPLFELLKQIGFSPSLISWTYVFGCFFLGGLGVYKLGTYNFDLNHTTGKVKHLHSNKLAGIGAYLLFTFSMFSLWIFGHPNFLFLSAYASIPIIIYLLLKLSHDSKHIKSLSVLLVLITLLFLTSGLNLVAFGLYICQVILIVVVISHEKLKSFKMSLIWGGATILMLLVSLQALNTYNEGGNIYQNFKSYVYSLNSNEAVKTITRDITGSEIYRGDLINSIRFGGGWMELQTANGSPVFENYDQYQKPLFLILGIIPLSFVVIFSIRSSKEEKSFAYKALTILMIVGLLLISKYPLLIIKDLEYVSDALRWISSKMWPLYIIPLTLLFGIYFEKLASHIASSGIKKSLNYSLILISLTSTILLASFPLLNGSLITEVTKVTLPQEFTELNELLPKASRVLVVPEPEVLYFRDLSWGYYGSDFMTYLTEAEIYDRANLYENNNEYNDLLSRFKSCTLSSQDIDYVLVMDPSGFENPCNYEISYSSESYTLFEVTVKSIPL